MFSLQPPRHISTLPKATVSDGGATCRVGHYRKSRPRYITDKTISLA